MSAGSSTATRGNGAGRRPATATSLASVTRNGSQQRICSRPDRIVHHLGGHRPDRQRAACSQLPAGEASMTVRVGGKHASPRQSSSASRACPSRTDLSRTRGSASANFDLPVSRSNRDFSALGNLTLNANAEVEQLSDFGTLTTIGGGLNWSPVDRLSLLASWTREEGAPSISQLGDPILDHPGHPRVRFHHGSRPCL